MPRTAEAVKAEMDNLLEKGNHHMSKPVRALRAELKELGGWKPKKRDYRERDQKRREKRREEAREQAQEAEVTVEVGPAASAAVPAAAPDAGYPALAPDPDEWAFLQKCIAELPIPLKGMTSNMFKQMYDRVVLQVKQWRCLRSIHAEIGPGGEFPPFGSLGLSSTTGDPVKPKVELKPVAVEPKPIDEVPNTTTAGMPIGGGNPNRQALIDKFKGRLPMPVGM